MKRLNKKGDMILATAFLVLLTGALFTTIIFNALSSNNELKVELTSPQLVESVYAQESQLNFYIQTILEDSVTKTRLDNDMRQAFMTTFLNELQEYKVDQNYILPELGQVESQITPGNINFENNAVSLTLRLKVEESAMKETFEDSKVTYVYTKTFSTPFMDISGLEPKPSIHYSLALDSIDDTFQENIDAQTLWITDTIEGKEYAVNLYFRKDKSVYLKIAKYEDKKIGQVSPEGIIQISSDQAIDATTQRHIDVINNKPFTDLSEGKISVPLDLAQQASTPAQ